MVADPSLLVTHLTGDDYRKILAHRVPYTGGTGPNPPCGAYPHTGAYVATTLRYLLPTLHSLGWTSVYLHVHGDQWTIRHAG